MPAIWRKWHDHRKIALTGIKPSGTPHWKLPGNDPPALEPAEIPGIVLIADYHALTTVKDGHAMSN
jgi:tryptophanyl-tRNA synthetase